MVRGSPHLVLSLLLCVAACLSHTTRGASPPTSPATQPHPSTLLATKSPLHLAQFNTTASTQAGKQPNPLEANGEWIHAFLQVLKLAANGGVTQQPNTGINPADLSNLMSRLPALLKGLTAVDLEGDNGAAGILDSIFSDPRAAGVPAWAEALTRGGNMSQADAQALQQMLNDVNATDAVETLLVTVFSDVDNGLQSLNLTANSSLEDVISAIMKDPGLMSSLSTEAIELLAQLMGESSPQDLLSETFPVDPTSQCAADLETWASDLMLGQLWALSMLDASGKLGAGVLEGQIMLFGDYDQCVDASHTTNTSHVIHGLLCGMAFTPPAVLGEYAIANMGIHLCVPESCHELHLYGLVQPTLEAIGSYNLGIQCYRPRDPEGDDIFLGVMITLAILVLLCAAGTFYGAVLDHRKKKQKEKKAKIPLVESGTYTNQGYVTNGEATGMQSGDHVNGKVTNGFTPLTQSSHHVNGKMTNGFTPLTQNDDHVNSKVTNGFTPLTESGNQVSSELPSAYVKHHETDAEKKDLKNAEACMANGQNANGVSYSIPDKKTTFHRPSPEEGMASKLLLSFSVLRNGRKVLSCEKNQADIACLHGIRVLSITWVVLGHCFSILNAVLANPMSIVEMFSHFTYMAIVGGVYAVDTFFLLSGCLSAFLFLRTTKKSGLTVSGMVLYYVHRYWRLTPLYGLLLAFLHGHFSIPDERPFQSANGMDSWTTCHDYWYHNILYINNVVDDLFSKSCMGWGWYLANDMQFSYIAPLVLIPWTFRKSWKKVNIIGFVLCGLLILTHCVATGVISYENAASLFVNADAYTEKIYFVPWCRVGPYAIGLLLGYVLFVTDCKYKMDKLSVVLGWTVAVSVGLTVVYVHYDNIGNIMTEGYTWNASQNAAFESLNKVVWAGCVSWVIFACCTGYGGFVNTLLSWSAWMPLSRLTYGVYLIHIIVLSVLAGNFKKPFFMDGWTATTLHLAVTVLSFLLSFVFSMLIEAPTLGLEKAVLGKIFQRKK